MDWPATLPNPTFQPYQWDVGLGMSATKMAGGNIRVRRFWRNLPHVFNLVFYGTTEQLSDMTAFAELVGSEWFNMPIASMYSSKDQLIIEATPLRFIGNIAVEAAGYDYWQISVAAEISDELFRTYFGTVNIPITRVWIVAGTPPAPSTDWVIARTPDNPSTDLVRAGTPGNPSVLV